MTLYRNDFHWLTVGLAIYMNLAIETKLYMDMLATELAYMSLGIIYWRSITRSLIMKISKALINLISKRR